MKSLIKLTSVISILLLLNACSSTTFVRHISDKSFYGNCSLGKVTVVAAPSAGSTTIAGKVKKAVEKEAADEELKGKFPIDLKITITQWQGREKVLGGGVTSKLLGSNTFLVGDVEYYSKGKLIGKGNWRTEHKEGGLLGSMTTTISFTDTDQFVIDRFAKLTIDQLK